jgi:hypothetical protein
MNSNVETLVSLSWFFPSPDGSLHPVLSFLSNLVKSFFSWLSAMSYMMTELGHEGDPRQSQMDLGHVSTEQVVVTQHQAPAGQHVTFP